MPLSPANINADNILTFDRMHVKLFLAPKKTAFSSEKVVDGISTACYITSCRQKNSRFYTEKKWLT